LECKISGNMWGPLGKGRKEGETRKRIYCQEKGDASKAEGGKISTCTSLCQGPKREAGLRETSCGVWGREEFEGQKEEVKRIL